MIYNVHTLNIFIPRHLIPDKSTKEYFVFLLPPNDLILTVANFPEPMSKLAGVRAPMVGQSRQGRGVTSVRGGGGG